jgi:type I restriction enzyme S subunit
MSPKAAGWARQRLKYVVACNTDVIPESTEPDAVFRYVDISNVSQAGVSDDAEELSFRDAPSRARRLAQPGDTLISTVRTYLRAVAAAPDFPDPTVYSTGLAVLRPGPDVHPRFLTYYAQSDGFIDRVVAHSVGVSYPAITATQLVTFDIYLPSMQEQEQIADYLDRETAKLDLLIDRSEQFIRLATERRSALIAAATTGQIDHHWKVAS